MIKIDNKKDYISIILKNYPRILKYIKNQTEELCLEAVKQNPYAIQHVKNQTPEICLAAVGENGYALRFVKKPTHESYVCFVLSLKEVQEYLRNHALAHKPQQVYEVLDNLYRSALIYNNIKGLELYLRVHGMLGNDTINIQNNQILPTNINFHGIEPDPDKYKDLI